MNRAASLPLAGDIIEEFRNIFRQAIANGLKNLADSVKREAYGSLED
jgi:hypothetical protein